MVSTERGLGRFDPVAARVAVVETGVQVLRDSRGPPVPAFDRTLLLNLQKQRDKAPVFPT